MIEEIIYTSAPRGLKPGSRGFCTVASTPGMASTLANLLESLSGYRHLFAPDASGRSANPPVYSHLRTQVGGQALHVLSRVVDAGNDYSGRSNKLAHHAAFTLPTGHQSSPAAMQRAEGLHPTTWSGDPRMLTSRGKLPALSSTVRPCSYWQQVTGDAGWGGFVAQQMVTSPSSTLWIVYPPDVNMLRLLDESLALLPSEQAWAATYTTFFTKLAPGIECRIRCVVDGTPEAVVARKRYELGTLDLCRPMDPPKPGIWIDAARNGKPVAAARPVAPASAAPVLVADASEIELADIELEEVDLSQVARHAPPPLPGGRPLVMPADRNRRRSREGSKAWIVAVCCLLLVSAIAGSVGVYFWWPSENFAGSEVAAIDVSEVEAARKAEEERKVEAERFAEAKKMAEAMRVAATKRMAEAKILAEAMRGATTKKIDEAKSLATAFKEAAAKRITEAINVSASNRIAKAEGARPVEVRCTPPKSDESVSMKKHFTWDGENLWKPSGMQAASYYVPIIKQVDGKDLHKELSLTRKQNGDVATIELKSRTQTALQVRQLENAAPLVEWQTLATSNQSFFETVTWSAIGIRSAGNLQSHTVVTFAMPKKADAIVAPLQFKRAEGFAGRIDYPQVPDFVALDQDAIRIVVYTPNQKAPLQTAGQELKVTEKTDCTLIWVATKIDWPFIEWEWRVRLKDHESKTYVPLTMASLDEVFQSNREVRSRLDKMKENGDAAELYAFAAQEKPPRKKGSKDFEKWERLSPLKNSLNTLRKFPQVDNNFIEPLFRDVRIDYDIYYLLHRKSSTPSDAKFDDTVPLHLVTTGKKPEDVIVLEPETK